MCTSLVVSLGWAIHPLEMARRKVDMDGEPKERCMYVTSSACARLWMEKRAVWGCAGGKSRVHRVEWGALWPERNGVEDAGEKNCTVVVV